MLAAGAEDLDDVASVFDPFDAQQQQADGAQQLADGAAQIDDGPGPARRRSGAARCRSRRSSTRRRRSSTPRATQAEAAGAPTEQLAALDAAAGAARRAGRGARSSSRTTLDASRAELDDQAEQLELGERPSSSSPTGSASCPRTGRPRSSTSRSPSRVSSCLRTSSRRRSTTSSPQPVDGVAVYFGPISPRAPPSSSASARRIGLVFAAIVLIVMLGSLAGRRAPDRHRARRRRRRRHRLALVLGRRRHGLVTPVLGVMLGLAVGIDYSLFIVYRHRKQLLRGVPVRESIGLANGTAGTAVVFAGSTVIVALLALNVTGIPFLGLMGTVGAVCVAVAVLVAITLAPALLGLARHAPAAPQARARIGAEITPAKAPKPITPMSNLRAILTVLGAVVALLVIAIPALSMRLGLPDGASEPAGSTSYQAFHDHRRGVRRGRERPAAGHARLHAEPHQRRRPPRHPGRGRPARSPNTTTWPRSRRSPPPTTTRSSPSRWSRRRGPTASRPSSSCRTSARLPPVGRRPHARRRRSGGEQHRHLGGAQRRPADLPPVVVGLSLLIMILVFRSLLVPLIATGGFVLSLFATYGLIVGRLPVRAGARRSSACTHRPDPELPAGHPRRHPVRARDGLPALPRLGDAGGLRPRIVGDAWRSRRASGPAARSSPRRRSSWSRCSAGSSSRSPR